MHRIRNDSNSDYISELGCQAFCEDCSHAVCVCIYKLSMARRSHTSLHTDSSSGRCASRRACAGSRLGQQFYGCCDAACSSFRSDSAAEECCETMCSCSLASPGQSSARNRVRVHDFRRSRFASRQSATPSRQIHLPVLPLAQLRASPYSVTPGVCVCDQHEVRAVIEGNSKCTCEDAGLQYHRTGLRPSHHRQCIGKSVAPPHSRRPPQQHFSRQDYLSDTECEAEPAASSDTSDNFEARLLPRPTARHQMHDGVHVNCDPCEGSTAKRGDTVGQQLACARHQLFSAQVRCARDTNSVAQQLVVSGAERYKPLKLKGRGLQGQPTPESPTIPAANVDAVNCNSARSVSIGDRMGPSLVRKTQQPGSNSRGQRSACAAAAHPLGGLNLPCRRSAAGGGPTFLQNGAEPSCVQASACCVTAQQAQACLLALCLLLAKAALASETSSAAASGAPTP